MKHWAKDLVHNYQSVTTANGWANGVAHYHDLTRVSLFDTALHSKLTHDIRIGDTTFVKTAYVKLMLELNSSIARSTWFVAIVEWFRPEGVKLEDAQVEEVWDTFNGTLTGFRRFNNLTRNREHRRDFKVHKTAFLTLQQENNPIRHINWSIKLNKRQRYAEGATQGYPENNSLTLIIVPRTVNDANPDAITLETYVSFYP